jgi:hypothetical protein
MYMEPNSVADLLVETSSGKHLLSASGKVKLESGLETVIESKVHAASSFSAMYAVGTSAALSKNVSKK